MADSKPLDGLRDLWNATEPAADDDERNARKTNKAKGKTERRRIGNRFAVLNSFCDFTLRELTRAEIAAWLTLYRDTKPDGLAKTSQADIGRRTGLNVGTVKRAIARLCGRGLLTVVRRGSLRRGPSVYRVRPLTKDYKK